MEVSPKKSNSTIYYQKNFEEHADKLGTLFPCWNWAAFFFGIGWLVYRGLSKEAFFVGVIEITTIFAVYFLGGDDLSALVWTLPIAIFVALYGTSLYGKKWIKEKNDHAKTHLFDGVAVLFTYIIGISILENYLFPEEEVKMVYGSYDPYLNRSDHPELKN